MIAFAHQDLYDGVSFNVGPNNLFAALIAEVNIPATAICGINQGIKRINALNPPSPICLANLLFLALSTILFNCPNVIGP